MKDTTSVAKRFKILYTLLGGEAETIYNRHIAETDKSAALRHVWRTLENSFGYQDHNLLVNFNKVPTLLSRARLRGSIPFWLTLAIARTGSATNLKQIWNLHTS